MSQTTATPEIYTLSLHDALPISSCCPSRSTRRTTRNSRTARIAIRDAEPGSFRTVLGADDDHSARGRASVVGGRIEPAQHLDAEHVTRGHLVEHPDVVDGRVVEDHADLVVEVDAGSPAPHNPSGLAVALAELHVGDRLPHRVPRRLRPGCGDRFGGDYLAGARLARPLAAGSRTATRHGRSAG